MLQAIRLGMVAFCCDLAIYVIMVALPFRLLSLGAGSLLLGSVPALYAAPYSVLVLFAGQRSDRRGRSQLIRLGAAIAAGGAVLLALAGQPVTIVACIPILSFGVSMIWPSIQAGFSELPGGSSLTRQIGIYNLSWSSGKALGFLIGGTMVAHWGAAASIACGAIGYCTAAVTVPRLARDAPRVAEAASRGEALPLSQRRAFLRATWIANGIAFGVGAVLNHHLPRLFVERGIEADRFGLLLGTIFAAQTTSFLLLARWRAWHYRLRLLVLVQFALATLALCFAFATHLFVLFPLAIALGLGLGFCYQSSLYYSLHAESGRGRQAGIHEASLGIAAALLPLAGGLWVHLSGDLMRPFWLASATLLASSIATGGMVLRARRRP